ncbi:MAG: hypothetical protein Q8N59_02480 [bacterium]|nr:hypothetical protein [bacterium]
MEKEPEFKNLDEEEIDDGLGVLVKKKTLYHGSGTSGIEAINRAEENTVGSGVYFTSKEEDAVGYAQRRSRHRKDASPIVYESLIENMKLLDLRKNENVKKILGGFKQILIEKLKDPNLKWQGQASLQKAIEAINSESINSSNLREITFSIGHDFSDYCKSLGYDGLIAIEGGEGEDIGIHDTYLIFDSEKAKIDKEKKLKANS